jgi:hypothetical protein
MEETCVTAMACVSLCSRDHRIGGSFSHTANEGPVRIQYNCLVHSYAFPEMKLCSIHISKTESSVSQFLHSYLCERFIYFPDRSVYFAAAKYVDRYWKYINRSQTHGCRNWEAAQFLFWEYINGIFGTVQWPGFNGRLLLHVCICTQVVSVTQLDRQLCQKRHITLGSPVYLMYMIIHDMAGFWSEL